MNFKVTISEVRECANKLQTALADFDTATNNTKAAADSLASMWEGDAREAFVAEQEKTIAWFQKMSQVVETYIKALEAAASVNEAFDIEGVNLIRQ
ncbi:MAG: WXG100 family type VII secretion target [Clostridia bacterium]|nr:WXG100 family type VII secretion target [Clostridia bacterium]